MVGTLPKTAYLLTNKDMVVGSFPSKSAIAYYLNVTVDMKTGTVLMNGERKGPGYIVKDDGMNNHWKSADDIIKDWANYHMKLPAGYGLYRYLVG